MSFFDYIIIFVFFIWLLFAFIAWKLIKLILKVFIKNSKVLIVLRNIFFLIVILTFIVSRYYDDHAMNKKNEKLTIINDFNTNIIKGWNDTVTNSEIWSMTDLAEKNEINDLIFFDFFDDPNAPCYATFCDDNYIYLNYLNGLNLSNKELKLLYEKKIKELDSKKLTLFNLIEISKNNIKEQMSKNGFESQYKFDHAKSLGLVNNDQYENFFKNLIDNHKNEFGYLKSCNGYVDPDVGDPLNPFPEIYGFGLYMDINQLQEITRYNGGYLDCYDENEYGTEKKCTSNLENNKFLRVWIGKISDNGPLRAYQIDVLHGNLSQGEEDRLSDAFKDKFKINGRGFSCDTPSPTIDGVLLDGYSQGFRIELNLGQGISFYGGNYFQNNDYNEITVWSTGEYRDKVLEYTNKLIKLKDQSDYLNSSGKFEGM
jgi:hypothetical protein